MTSEDEADLRWGAYVSNGIIMLEKVLNDEDIGVGVYYVAGSLIINIEDVRSPDMKFTTYEVKDMRELPPGDEWYLQYLISRMYVSRKKPTCSFYKQAEINIGLYEGLTK